MTFEDDEKSRERSIDEAAEALDRSPPPGETREVRGAERPAVQEEHDEQAITLSIRINVRTGREQEFEEYLQGINAAAERFPGFLGVRVFRPARGNRRYRIILRFERISDLQRWEESEERRIWHERGHVLAEAPPRTIDISGTAQERPLALARTQIDEFVQASVSGVGLLLLSAVVALVLANTPLSDSYDDFWATELTIGVERFGITETLQHWVNDGLMALFFFFVGLEIKREVLVGELRYLRQAAFPVAASFGGVAVPALIYVLFNLGDGATRGWAIPMGTDTAFALGILSLFVGRIQPVLIVFLTATAIVDDILAVLVIAFFYTDEISWWALGASGLLMAVLIVANRAGVRHWPIYAVLGLAVWLAIFESGVHGTVAGVMVAMVIPARSWINPREYLARARRLLDNFEAAGYSTRSMLSNEDQQHATQALMRLSEDVEPPLTHFEHRLSPWVAFGVLPIFALANAGIPLLDGIGEALNSTVAWGVAAGLVIGKPLGITLFAWLAVRLGMASMPRDIRWRQILGVASLGGIGFTMSLFITELAFGTDGYATEARIGILLGSLIAGTLGYLTLSKSLPSTTDTEQA